MHSDADTVIAPEHHPKMMTALKDDLGTEEPQSWPVGRKLGASVAGFGYAFALLYTAVSYAAGIQGVVKEFQISMEDAVVPFSLFIFGIAFAPLYAPHVSERFGRNRFYVVATTGMAAFTLGIAYCRTYAQLCVLRFFAGLFGGSNVVQIEGTFADVWPALYTSSYYSFITGAQYFGAATGAVVGFHVVPLENWRWSQFTSLMVILAALLLGVNAPETYRRELVRRRARQLKEESPLEPAQSGTTISEMVKLTLIDPLIMMFTQPVVLAISLFLGLNFGVLFQFFISDPAVLQKVAMFTPPMIGSAFTTAIGGIGASICAALVIDQAVVRSIRKKLQNGSMDIEFRMFAAIFGAILMLVSLYMIAFTVNPRFSPAVPVAGNGLYVMGSAITLTSFVPYLFDAYGPQGTLSALTAAAVFRVVLAGAIPLTVVRAAAHPGPKYYILTWAVIATVFLTIPVFVLVFGRRLRENSRFFHQKHISLFKMELGFTDEQEKEQGQDMAKEGHVEQA